MTTTKEDISDFMQSEIEQIVCNALSKLKEHDTALLEIDCNERSITHRLAMYLQDEFVGWHVDCEYNRDHDSPDLVKRLNYPTNTKTNDIHAKTVFPDIIIHHRNKTDSLLVIEVKKSTNPEPVGRDKEKLKAFNEQLKYRFALFM